jgi:hypothetical protein
MPRIRKLASQSKVVKLDIPQNTAPLIPEMAAPPKAPPVVAPAAPAAPKVPAPAKPTRAALKAKDEEIKQLFDQVWAAQDALESAEAKVAEREGELQVAIKEAFEVVGKSQFKKGGRVFRLRHVSPRVDIPGSTDHYELRWEGEEGATEL